MRGARFLVMPLLVGLIAAVACANIIGSDFGDYRVTGLDASASGASSGGDVGAGAQGGSASGATGDGGLSYAGTGGSGGAQVSGGTSGEGGTPSTRRRVFVTSHAWTGDLTTATGNSIGIEAADALCNVAAASARLGGVWTAFISGRQSNAVVTNAVDRIPDVGPWYLVDQATLVFASKQAFWSTHVALSMTELGTAVDASVSYLVWTGTKTDGTQFTNRCGDWSATTGTGTCGSPTSTISTWASSADQNCSGAGRLYCFETGGVGTATGSGGTSSGSGGTGTGSGGMTGRDGGKCVVQACTNTCTIASPLQCCKSDGSCGCSWAQVGTASAYCL